MLLVISCSWRGWRAAGSCHCRSSPILTSRLCGGTGCKQRGLLEPPTSRQVGLAFCRQWIRAVRRGDCLARCDTIWCVDLVLSVAVLGGTTAGFIVYLVAAATGRDKDLRRASGRRAGALYATLFGVAVLLTFAWMTMRGAPWSERIVASLLAGAFGAFEVLIYLVGFDYGVPRRSSKSARDGQ